MTLAKPWVRVVSLLGAWCVSVPGSVGAQQSASGAAAVETRELTEAGVPLTRALSVPEGPVIDGDVLSDPAYADARLATGFVQNRPFEGQPSSERTEVRIVYTSDTLYFGIVCYMEDPSSIISADSRRDSDLTETDSFQILLDTYLDGQNRFIFGTNPAGVEYDGQVTNEGQGSGRRGGGRSGNNRQQRGSGGGFNLNWDGAWQVVTSVTDIGWHAEIAIPFRTLRYPTTDVQSWGMNFQRNIRARNEQSYWSPLPRQYDLNRISAAGELQGLRVPPQRNLQFTPYMLGQTLHSTESSRNLQTGDIGADLKYSVTPSMTLDLTLNTDFAQVEVDDEQVNLDRFTLFFPREAGRSSSRTPGCFPWGSQGPSISSSAVGSDLTAASKFQSSVAAVCRARSARAPTLGFSTCRRRRSMRPGLAQQNFTVGRVRQDLPNRSNVGAIFVNRQATGSLAGDRDYNRTYAFDGRLGIGQGGTVSGYVAETDTPGAATADSHAYGLTAQHESERVRLNLAYTEVAPNFNPEVGFLARPELSADERERVHDVPPRQFPGHP